MEIFLAFSLLSLCIIPLTEVPQKYFRKEIKSLQELELARYEEITLLSIMQNLVLKHPLSAIAKNKKEAQKTPFFLDPIVITLDGLARYKYFPSYILWKKRHKEGNDGSSYEILHLEISFRPQNSQDFFRLRPFKHKIFVKEIYETKKKSHYAA